MTLLTLHSNLHKKKTVSEKSLNLPKVTWKKKQGQKQNLISNVTDFNVSIVEEFIHVDRDRHRYKYRHKYRDRYRYKSQMKDILYIYNYNILYINTIYVYTHTQTLE